MALLPFDVSARNLEATRAKCHIQDRMIEHIRFSAPLHECDGRAVVEHFYSCAFQDLHFRHSACRLINLQPKPPIAFFVHDDSHLRIVRRRSLDEVREEIRRVLFERLFSGSESLG